MPWKYGINTVCVFQAELFQGKFSGTPAVPQMFGDKLHNVFTTSRSFLENLLGGYTLPEPFFTTKLQSTVNTLMKTLRDPALPLYELQV